MADETPETKVETEEEAALRLRRRTAFEASFEEKNAYLMAYEIYRDKLFHEDELISQRTTWFITFQSFLFISYAILRNGLTGGEGTTDVVFWVTMIYAFVGILTCYYTILSVVAAHNAAQSVEVKWLSISNLYKDKAEEFRDLYTFEAPLGVADWVGAKHDGFLSAVAGVFKFIFRIKGRIGSAKADNPSALLPYPSLRGGGGQQKSGRNGTILSRRLPVVVLIAWAALIGVTFGFGVAPADGQPTAATECLAPDSTGEVADQGRDCGGEDDAT